MPFLIFYGAVSVQFSFLLIKRKGISVKAITSCSKIIIGHFVNNNLVFRESQSLSNFVLWCLILIRI